MVEPKNGASRTSFSEKDKVTGKKKGEEMKKMAAEVITPAKDEEKEKEAMEGDRKEGEEEEGKEKEGGKKEGKK